MTTKHVRGFFGVIVGFSIILLETAPQSYGTPGSHQCHFLIYAFHLSQCAPGITGTERLADSSVQLHNVMELHICTGMAFLISHEKNGSLSNERRFSHATREIRVAKIGCSFFSIGERNSSSITLLKDFLSCVEKKHSHKVEQEISVFITQILCR